MKFYNNLKKNKKPICVWGTGYIGLSTLAYYSKNKINALGYDINKNLIDDLNKGTVKNDDFKKWLGFDIKSLIKKKKTFIYE
jgi:UDP-N-acetyl-D-mannosaminuronate dehydrogenase